MFQFFPWTNSHQLNLDWILEFLKHIPWTVNGKEADPETHNINLAGWEGGVLEIDQGGTGMSDLQVVSTASDIAEPATADFTLNSARIQYWGKVAAIRIAVTTANALSGTTHIATLKSDWQPGYSMILHEVSPTIPITAEISGGNGKINVTGSVNANAIIVLEGIYLLG